MVSLPGLTPIDPTSTAFLLAENRHMPMHVGGLQLFERPKGAGPDYVRSMFEHMRDTAEVSPLFLKHPHRSARTAGALVWRNDAHFDIEHHLRHSALPQPGRVRELLELVGRLHSTRLAWERPLWEMHVIEGLADGRIGLYTKLHHALVDGVSAMRLMASGLSTDPDQREMPAPFALQPRKPRAVDDAAAALAHPASTASRLLTELPADALRSALAITADAAGMPGALVRTLRKGLRNETSAVSLAAPRTIFNQSITGARRFAAQDWEVERLQAVSRATGTTINDVVLAMCSGAMRTYLGELDALPDASLVSMVPVSLKVKQAGDPNPDGGNAIGSVMVRLATDVADPAERLSTIHRSMKDGKEALSSMTPTQIVAMSAIGMAPSIVVPALRLQGMVRPPFNLIISNVPGPRSAQYWNGSKLVGAYPASIPINGMALNITCTSYNGNMAFGLTGCRRAVPRLQRLLTHLDDELAALESAAGVA
ncbi:wax ester/triacylglycerol synthase family O-acyltransferase [Nocardioides sp.]|uniref:WS/DGAT/MGAT family O-acyltransferase n=1 Tax=Nocardioides sp. TaxID=35761 RepID=UPI0035114A9B